MKTAQLSPTRLAERFLVCLEDSPWGQLYRVVVGFLIVPGTSFFLDDDNPSGWALGTCLSGVLFALRLGPAVARQLLPFSRAVRQIWMTRRQMAKRYDSYQWRKLFWFGLGLTVDILVFDSVTAGGLVLTSVCLMSGAVGMLAWRVYGAPTERVRWLRSEHGLS